MKELLGRLVNRLGCPGIVRETDYRAGIADINVRVRTSHLFTVVTVNDVDVYFKRLSGRIDGAGFSPTSDYKRASAGK